MNFRKNKKNKLVVFLDRDGTLIEGDFKNQNNEIEGIYLGSKNNWKSQIKFLPKVILGLKSLSKKTSNIFIVSSQSGVALKGRYNLLTLLRAKEINNYITKLINKNGVTITGSEICPFINPKDVKKYHIKNIPIDPKYVKNDKCIKPKPGMVLKFLKKIDNKQTQLVMIGDRYTDIQTIINTSKESIGILVPSIKTNKTDIINMNKLILKYPKQFIIKKNFLSAVNWLIKKKYD